MPKNYIPRTGYEYGLSLLGARPDPTQQSGLQYGLSQLRRAAGTTGQPQTGLQYGLQQFGNFLSRIGRPAMAEPAGPNPLQGDPTGRYIPGFMQNVRQAGDIGGDGRSDEERALLSQYAPKPFPMTPSGQFERYFKTPEMDQYFGAASRGTAAPKDVEAMQALAGRTVAPGKTPEELSAFYRAESAMGRAQMPEIQKGLGYEKGTPLAQWAAANPMLAQRLYAQKQAGPQYGGGVATGAFGSNAPTLGSEDFAVAANAVPAPWNQQGAKVSADFSEVMPFQASKTLMAEGMPALPTTLDKAEDFLARTKAGSSFADPNMAKAWGSVLH